MEIHGQVFHCHNNQETLLTFRVWARVNKHPALYRTVPHNEEHFPPRLSVVPFELQIDEKPVYIGLNLEPNSVLRINAVLVVYCYIIKQPGI